MNSNLPLVPDPLPVPQTITVWKDIAALELLPTHSGAHAGRITPIPQGARLEICGPGFTERTVRVRWNGRLGFVFLQDVEPVPSAHPAGPAQARSASDFATA